MTHLVSRSAAVALVLASLLFAGCTVAPSESPGTTGRSWPADGAAFAFGGPVKVGDAPGVGLVLKLGRSEAFVATHGDAVIVCTHGTLTGPALTWSSLDGGATFAQVTFPPETAVAGDCDVQIGPDGTWYVLHSHLMASTLSVSHDQGATWATRPVTAPPISIMADRPWLLATDDALYLTYMDIYVLPGAVMVTRSADEGETWSTPILLAAPGTDAPHHMHGRALHTEDDRILVPIRDMTDTNLLRAQASFGGPVQTTLTFAVSTDDGATWTRGPILAPLAGHSTFPMAAESADGTLFHIEPLQNDGLVDIAVFHSTDGGDTWSDPLIVGEGFHMAPQAWIDGGADGTAVVAWVGGNTTTGRDMHLWAARIDTHPATPTVEQTDLGVAEHPEFIMVTHDHEDRAMIVHTSEDVMWLHHESP